MKKIILTLALIAGSFGAFAAKTAQQTTFSYTTTVSSETLKVLEKAGVTITAVTEDAEKPKCTIKFTITTPGGASVSGTVSADTCKEAMALLEAIVIIGNL